MLDPEARAARVREAGRDPAAGVVLVDLVLGRGVHPDPAGPLAAAVRDARAAATAAGRPLAAVASVVGTAADPQGLAGQVAALEAAGCEVLPSNAQAARFAALLARPALATAMLS
jgi:FdrA protein